MDILKHILGLAGGFAILAIIILAAIGWTTVTDSGEMVARHRLNSAISETSHLRNLNWLLSRQLERQQHEEQLNQ